MSGLKQGFDPTPRYWLQCVADDGSDSWISSRKNPQGTLALAGDILRQQPRVEYVLILDGKCDRNAPGKDDILGDVNRNPLPGSRLLV